MCFFDMHFIQLVKDNGFAFNIIMMNSSKLESTFLIL